MMVAFYRAMGQQQAPSETPRVGPTQEQLSALMDHIADILAGDGTPEQRRAELGRFALAAQAAPEEAIVGPFADLKDTVWPANFHCPTIDAETGVPRLVIKTFPGERGVTNFGRPASR